MRKLFTLTINLFTIFFIITAHANNATKPFALNTNAFSNHGLIPNLYSCNGKNTSPQLDWMNPPANTRSFVLILSDINAPSGIFYHWVLYNIPSTITSLAQGEQTTPGAELGTNSFDRQQYDGPCPPKGTKHTYIFHLYALDDNLTLPANADAKTVLHAIQKHILAIAQLTAIYNN